VYEKDWEDYLAVRFQAPPCKEVTKKKELLWVRWWSTSSLTSALLNVMRGYRKYADGKVGQSNGEHGLR
jgi:hypothetical protein